MLTKFPIYIYTNASWPQPWFECALSSVVLSASVELFHHGNFRSADLVFRYERRVLVGRFARR